MANEILLKDITPIVWADTTDYSSTVSGLTRTAQIDLTSLGSTSARQGAKVDLGATRYALYNVHMALEYATAPASGEVCEVYFSFSPSPTAGNANPGGASGADAAYTGEQGDSTTDSLPQMMLGGSFVLTSTVTTDVIYSMIGTIMAPTQYVSPVVFNRSAADALHSDAVEMYLALMPVTPEVQ